MKRYFVLLLALGLLLVGCASAVPGTESSATQSMVYIPATVPTVALPAIPEGEELQMVERFWQEELRREIVWYDPVVVNPGRCARNYGTYEGYLVIYEQMGGVPIEKDVCLDIGNKTFWDDNSFIIWAFQGGAYARLEELYAEGKIGDAAIDRCLEIHQWYEEMDIRRYMEPLFEVAFGREAVWYNEDTESGLRNYGKITNFYVLYVPDPAGQTEHTIGTTTLRSRVPFEIYIYVGEFIKLEDYIAEHFRPDSSWELLQSTHEAYEEKIAKTNY